MQMKYPMLVDYIIKAMEVLIIAIIIYIQNRDIGLCHHTITEEL